MRCAAIVLAGLMMAAAMASSASAGPKPAKGEPPMIEVGQLSDGVKTYRQDFTGPDQTVAAITPSVAQAFWALGGEGQSYPAATLRVRCEILPGGTALGGLCTAIPGASPDAERLFALVRAADGLPQVTGYRAVPLELRKRWVLSRFVEYNLTLPAVTAPSVDLASGDLVDHKLVDAPLGRLMSEYPSRALRNAAEGVVTMACQVQSDLSIICRDQSFEPAANLQYFPDRQRRIFGGAKAAPLLTDGRAAQGKRFIVRLVYRIPQ